MTREYKSIEIDEDNVFENGEGEFRQRRPSDTFSPVLSPDLVAIKVCLDSLVDLRPDERARAFAHIMRRFVSDHEIYSSISNQLWAAAEELHSP